MKLHLVDATFELFRAYYSRPPRRAPDGRPVNAVQGLIDSMLSLLREPDVTHIGAATDYVIESWRNDLYPGYKSSAGMDPDLMAQFRDAERALSALGMPVWAMVEDEADDAIATAVARFASDPRVEQVIICSVDKDLAQLVDGDRASCCATGCAGSPTTRPASSRSSASRRSRSRTTWPSSVTAATAFPGCPAGVRRARPPSWQSWSTSTTSRRRCSTGRLDLRNASRLAATLQDQRPARRPVSDALRRSTATPTSPRRQRSTTSSGMACARERFVALCEELGFDTVRERVHRWAD